MLPGFLPARISATRFVTGGRPASSCFTRGAVFSWVCTRHNQHLHFVANTLRSDAQIGQVCQTCRTHAPGIRPNTCSPANDESGTAALAQQQLLLL